jgi:glutathione synthase/RimK-type ligase-like ATP-grasp enzyme
MDFLGISRSPIYSPHSEDRDAQIFNQLSAELRARNFQVTCLSEDEFDDKSVEILCNDAPIIFSMGRHPHVLRLLAKMQQQGCVVVNSASGIMRLSRRNIYALQV